MRVELFLALRLLRDARAQSVLISAGAAVGVSVLIFLTALIAGLQRDLIARTVGSQSHITLESADENPRVLRNPEGAVVIADVQKVERRVRSLDGASQLLERVRDEPGVIAAAPICRGPATAIRGGAEENVVVTGVETESFQSVIDVRNRLTDGGFVLDSNQAVIGSALASTLGLAVGERFRLTTANRPGGVYQVSGVVRFGVARIDESWVLLSMRNAQTLLGLPGGVTGIEAAVSQIYEAEAIAERLRRNTGLRVESWMARNAELLSGLRSQSASSNLIQAFVLIAVAIGIASVLIVSVVQRRKEIGILRAMGLSRRLTQRVFLLQGAMLGMAGAMLGAALGTLLIAAFKAVALRSNGMRLFPIDLSLTLLLSTGIVAIVTGVLSAVFPARRAASLDPAVAIRNE